MVHVLRRQCLSSSGLADRDSVLGALLNKGSIVLGDGQRFIESVDLGLTPHHRSSAAEVHTASNVGVLLVEAN